MHAERWRHVHGCARFFNALRDTITDHFLATYRAGEPMPERARRRQAVSGRRIDSGGRVDRSRAIRFTFDGKAYSGFAGDTLASALLANGVHLVRPLVQVSPAARHHRRRLRGAQRAGHA